MSKCSDISCTFYEVTQNFLQYRLLEEETLMLEETLRGLKMIMNQKVR